MNNKIRLIDINIVSEYMGRFLTLIVTLLVLAITLSALVGGDGILNRTAITVEVPRGSDPERNRALRQLIASETGRLVTVSPREADWNGAHDLYVLPVREFMAARARFGLEPLYSLCRMKRRSEAAILISRSGVEPPESPGVGDVLFVDPYSINGCWLQLAFLESTGYRAPANLEQMRFAPAPGGGTRVVYSVLYGETPIGACRLSDLLTAVRAGDIGKNELSVVKSIPALPETVIACRPGDREYFEPVFRRIAATIAAPEESEMAVTEILSRHGLGNLRPVSDDDLERLSQIFEFVKGRIGRAAADP
jgi:hypothetical protein